jgi:hypothetical protein
MNDDALVKSVMAGDAAERVSTDEVCLCLMARTPRTLSRRDHAEAKAGENIGQGKPREVE